MDYAVIQTGGKQYRVAPGDVITVEKLEGEPGTELAFEEVLLASQGGAVQIGSPTLAGASVTAQIVEQGRGARILVFKKKRRKKYRRRQGHRQWQTRVRVGEIRMGTA